MTRTCEFYFDGTVTLTEQEIWPDGDAPENWTATDVRKLIQDTRGDWLDVWNMKEVVECAVSDDLGNTETGIGI